MSVRRIDSHVHLSRYLSPPLTAAQAMAAGLYCVSVTETPADFEAAQAALGALPQVTVALGVHPLHAAELTDVDLDRFDELAGEVRWLGEVGLDGSPEGHETLEAQRRAFSRVLGHPGLGERLLTVHSRGAEGEVVERLAQASARGVLHWFRGTPDEAADAVRAGLRFSINPAMLASQAGLALIDAVPPEHLLTETDGPYTSVEGRPSTPADVEQVLEVLGERWGVGASEARARVWENFLALDPRAGS